MTKYAYTLQPHKIPNTHLLKCQRQAMKDCKNSLNLTEMIRIGSLQQEFSMFVTSTSHLIINRDPIQMEFKSVQESREGQPLSTYEAEESTRPLPKDETKVSVDEAQESGRPPSRDEAEISTYKAKASMDEAEASRDEREGCTNEAEQLEQPLSNDEAWMLFRRIAFKDNPAPPMDIQECAKNIADKCKGFGLAITLVAAAMRGKSRVDEWETSLSSIKMQILLLLQILCILALNHNSIHY